MNKKIVVVGGVAGGASAAARLRRLDEHADIVMLERGEYISFANCGLPYYIGGEITRKEALTLQTPKSFHARFRVDVRVRNEVTAINREAKTVTVKNLDDGKIYDEPYDMLVLSMGAEPVRPPVPGLDCDRVFFLRNIPDTYAIKAFLTAEQPKSAVIMGGGYIGVEMAENLHRLGLAVTIIETQDQVIAALDYDMACDVHHHIKSKGVQLLLGTAVESVEEAGQRLRIRTKTESIRADMLFVAVGVRPESAIAQQAGLVCNKRGAIVVDTHMCTSDPAIYAVGDAVEICDFVTGETVMIPLAGPAGKQGRIAADNICGGDCTYTGTQGSAILRVFDMTVATTGIGERVAKAQNLACDKSFTYSQSHAEYFPGSGGMSVKLVYRPESGKLLGAQITGFDGVDKRCDVLATAIRFGATIRDLTRLELCYAPPYSSAKDPVNMAGYVVENILDGNVRAFHWHDVDRVRKDASNVLLDVRTTDEFRRSHMEGAVNIPLDELRDRLSELDTKKRYYITCAVGLRGYVACRILSQRGFETWNLSGGYRLYDSIFKGKTLPPDIIGIKK